MCRVCGTRRGPICAYLDFLMQEKDSVKETAAIEGRLIVGLGNPEEDYADTRHNLGFACVRELARRLGVRTDRKRWQSLVGRSETQHVWLVLPQTYMNLSGQAVAKAMRDIGSSSCKAAGRARRTRPTRFAEKR